jgi:hypothetical protein
VLKKRVDGIATTCDLAVNFTDAQLADTLALRIMQGGYHYFVIDHVCWSPALVFPIVDICRRVRELEREGGVAVADRCVVIVDGAHAIGNVDLKPVFAAQKAQLASSHGTIPLFDAYLSNCHKWLMAPKSVAMLYTAPMWHRVVHPVVIGNNCKNHLTSPDAGGAAATSSGPDHVSKMMQREFFCPGTRDHSAYLVVGDTISFRRDVLGGEERIRDYCFDLAYRAAEAIAARWASHLVITNRNRLCSMTNVYCPPSMSADGVRRVVSVMLSKYQCFGAIGELEGRPFLRISAQVRQKKFDGGITGTTERQRTALTVTSSYYYAIDTQCPCQTQVATSFYHHVRKAQTTRNGSCRQPGSTALFPANDAAKVIQRIRPCTR